MKRPMVAFLTWLLLAMRSRFTRRARLEAENLILSQQLVILRRKFPRRVRLWNLDRLLLVWLYRLYPSLLDAIIIVQPDTLFRWNQRGFRAYWHWKSRHVGGRPRIDSDTRALIRRMSRENPLWGAPRIHGELLMLGIQVAESTVGRYMVGRRRPPSQGWKIFLRNHAAGIASLDLFVVRTISFKRLHRLVILRHARRRLVTISEAQLRRVLKNYASYYNQVRRTSRWTRMHRIFAAHRSSVPSQRYQSLANSIINTSGFRF